MPELYPQKDWPVVSCRYALLGLEVDGLGAVNAVIQGPQTQAVVEKVRSLQAARILQQLKRRYGEHAILGRADIQELLPDYTGAHLDLGDRRMVELAVHQQTGVLWQRVLFTLVDHRYAPLRLQERMVQLVLQLPEGEPKPLGYVCSTCRLYHQGDPKAVEWCAHCRRPKCAVAGCACPH